MPVTVRVDTVGFRDLAGRFRRNTPANTGEFRDGMRDIVQDVVRQARLEAPYRTGKLADSIEYDVDQDQGTRFHATVTVGVDYAPYVIEGTRPHMIYPRRAKALAFTVGGSLVFAKKVRHPGTKPNDFLARAVKQVELNRRTRQIVGRITADLTR